MLAHLTQYFAQHGQLILPNIGVLQLEKEEKELRMNNIR